MVYLDASVLVAVLAPEARSGDAERLPTQSALTVRYSDWTRAETVATFSAKVRSGKLSEEWRIAARAQLNQIESSHLQRVGVFATDFRRAEELCDRPVGLRAGDALHLAIADRIGADLVTLDRRQAEAGQALGLRCRLL